MLKNVFSQSFFFLDGSCINEEAIDYVEIPEYMSEEYIANFTFYDNMYHNYNYSIFYPFQYFPWELARDTLSATDCTAKMQTNMDAGLGLIDLDVFDTLSEFLIHDSGVWFHTEETKIMFIDTGPSARYLTVLMSSNDVSYLFFFLS